MILAPKKQEIAPKMNMVCWSENFIMRRNRKTINQTQNGYTPLPKHGKMMMAFIIQLKLRAIIFSTRSTVP
jgi:hypothetical protein